MKRRTYGVFYKTLFTFGTLAVVGTLAVLTYENILEPDDTNGKDSFLSTLKKFPAAVMRNLRAVPKFHRREEVANIDCRRLLNGDEDYASVAGKSRKQMVHHSLDMSCEGVRERVIGKYQSPKIDYSLAFARVVYTDYEFLEFQLAVSYSEENHFCFSIDSDADFSFRDAMKKLSSCLPNVYIPARKFNIDSDGHNANSAQLDCLEILSENGEWQYVMLLQNHDIVFHTNAELAEIYKALDGSNDVLIMNVPDGRVKPELDWDAKALNLFTNDILTQNETSGRLELSRGYAEASLSRDAAMWLVKDVNLTTLIQRLNSAAYSVDEQLLSSLQNSETLGMPGSYHSACLRSLKASPYHTRYSQFSTIDTGCKAGNRHSICILGVEDLPFLNRRIRAHNLVLNKMMPDFDFGAISCVAELLFNKTHFDMKPDVDREYFAASPVVKYNQFLQQGLVDIHNYTCP